MISWIIKRIEIFLLVFGALILAATGSSLYKSTTEGLPDVALVEQLEEKRSSIVVISSPIEDAGYWVEKSISGDKEKYFYFGQLGESPIFLSSTSELEETGHTTIVGFVSRFYGNDDYEKLETAVCEDLGIDHDTFNEIFSPYIIEVKETGENAREQYDNSSLNGIIFSASMIIAGIIILAVKLSKKKKKKEVLE